MSKQTLQVLPHNFTIHSLDSDQAVPAEVISAEIFFIAKTSEELSIVCPSDLVFNSFATEPHWRALEVIGPLGFSLTGIMANISGVLASANVSIFSISTYDTDYILVKEAQLPDAIKALKKDGYLFV
ncbi:ACT domain-containing protein [Pseudoalteromonas sp. McH1-42]|uniref:ACT domain-containing protein n=1 Tax=Pseudoalteromonas sp. McH1-42 TaxID=2917752 RepID=UPI001EF4BD61|nr:ACT domain-containing protein [Pseudoalteromonas sp. McH1-42]MCG7564503.1 ACT domain-containing protein [Pseudoalteromonas sp. McH1-42]